MTVSLHKFNYFSVSQVLCVRQTQNRMLLFHTTWKFVKEEQRNKAQLAGNAYMWNVLNKAASLYNQVVLSS